MSQLLKQSVPHQSSSLLVAQSRQWKSIIHHPSHLASAAQVRQYIVHILYGEYDIPQDEAEAVAALWQGALALEFYFPQQELKQLEELFGEKYGDMINEYRINATGHYYINMMNLCIRGLAWLVIVGYIWFSVWRLGWVGGGIPILFILLLLLWIVRKPSLV